jgi:putative ABC transport system substrate-binding protein
MESGGNGGLLTRRQSIAVIGTVALGLLPPRVHAQQTNPLIGFLSARSPDESAGVVAAFRAGLAEAGFIEGRNVALVFRWAEGNYQQLESLAAELVELKVSVLIAAGGPPSALAAKSATTKSMIPVMFSAASDSVRLGLVKSFNNPVGNVTGMASLTTELASKVIQVLKEALPGHWLSLQPFKSERRARRQASAGSRDGHRSASPASASQQSG